MQQKRKRGRELTSSEMGKLGGAARAARLSPERRSAIARKAVIARWKRSEVARRKKKAQAA